MAIKFLLLPLTGEPTSENAALQGLLLAKRLGAHVTSGHDDGLGPLDVAPDLLGSAYNYGAFYGHMQKARHERKAHARQFFDRAVQETKLPIVNTPVCQQASTMWVEDHGGSESPLSRFGAFADLIVLEQPGNNKSPVVWNIVENALFSVRRPILIVPQSPSPASFLRPIVAWNGSAESAHALQQAVRLFEPGAKVTVAQIGRLKSGRLPAERAMEYLGWHCFEAEYREFEEQSEKTNDILLQEADRIEATCFVMGAYTHSRTRQMLLGGVTDFMLRAGPLPILMAH